MSKKNKGIIKRYRPDGFDSLIPGLVEDCMKAGGIEVDDSTREKSEAFIRYCIGVGADSMLEGIRAYGADALIRGRKILFVLSKIAVPGRPQYRDAGMSFRDNAGYSGPGRVCFVPADKEIIKLPPGSLSGGGNGGKK
ncbi:hypothetical protein LCGC14_2391660 [marine sediment metagenome]|uniref:Uncharacterized protein n=1 Tax=marine sediment metagenome TaxID=412755 RepID=A0A0F9BY06_9ZZZZ